VRLTVTDHGVGFTAASVKQELGSGGFGLFSIRERIRHVGGRLLIRSSPGRGTTVILQVPMKPHWPLPLHTFTRIGDVPCGSVTLGSQMECAP
jgi:signal transduction histidine kinase